MKRLTLMLWLACLMPGCGLRERSDGDAVASPEPTPAVGLDGTPTSEETSARSAQAYSVLLKSADELIQKREWNEVIRVLSQAISTDPHRPEAYIKRAAILAETRQGLPNAVADMTAAIKCEPDNPKLLNTRGYFLLLTQQYDRAEQDFNDAIGLELNYPQPYNNRGLVWIARGMHTSGDASLPAEDDHSPNSADFFKYAVRDFDNALRIKPDYLDALNNRGFALMQLDRLDEAVEAFSQALSIDPKYLNGLANRGRAYMRLKRDAEAAEDFSRAIEIQPDQLQYYSLRSEAYRADGQEQSAAADAKHVAWGQQLGDFNQLIIRSPENAELWAARGRHLLLEDRFEDAEQSFAKALSLSADHAPALIGRALVHMQHQNFEEAVADCNVVLEQSPTYEAQSLRGDAYFRMGRFQEAIADYEAVKRFDSQVVTAYRKRAERHRAQGDPKQAEADEALAAAMEQQLTARSARPAAAPREFVVKQTNYETTAAADSEAQEQ